jgi:hypothetical protein
VDRAAAGHPPIQTLPALRALPQFSFRGQMGNEAVFGYSADRLDTAGYLPLSKVLDPDDDPEPRRRYVSELLADDRLLLAHELAEGAQALRRLSYIHGDINPPNLFVNIGECHVALIDFDSGAVTDAPDEAPTTFGKQADGEWVAPEIMDQMLARQGGPAVVTVDRFTDDWAVTVGIHYLLFLCGPFLVLRRASSRCIRDYVTRFGWPGYDAADPLFDPDLADAHARYLEMLAEMPSGVVKRMSEALNGGALEPVRRALPYQWTLDLRGGRDALEILLFQAEPETLLEGRPVRLTWRVAGSRWAHVDNGIGEVGETGTCQVFPTASTAYTLTARARGGETLTENVSVHVLPIPRLETVFVPAPELSHTVILRNLHVPAPSVRLAGPRIRVAAPAFRVPLALSLAVRFGARRVFPVPPGPSPPPPGGAAGASGRGLMAWVPRIGGVFGRIHERVKAELITRFGGTP